MWSSSLTRRGMLVAALAALTSCTLRPAFGPLGGSAPLVNGVALPEPTSADTLVLRNHLVERLGDASNPKWRLKLVPKVKSSKFSGADADRIVLSGAMAFDLEPVHPDLRAVSGSVAATSSYTVARTSAANTSFAISNRAAADDGRQRLMVLLADRMIDRIIVELARVPG